MRGYAFDSVLDEQRRAREWMLFVLLRRYLIPLVVSVLIMAFFGWPVIIVLLIIKDSLFRAFGL